MCFVSCLVRQPFCVNPNNSESVRVCVCFCHFIPIQNFEHFVDDCKLNSLKCAQKLRMLISKTLFCIYSRPLSHCCFPFSTDFCVLLFSVIANARSLRVYSFLDLNHPFSVALDFQFGNKKNALATAIPTAINTHTPYCVPIQKRLESFERMNKCVFL